MKVLNIGRSQENDIVVNDNRVSRVHVQLVQEDNGNCAVVDLNSVNGTFVNGQRITGEYYLRAGDSVIIGDTYLTWQSYLNTPTGAINVDVPVSQPKCRPKRAIWFILVIAIALLACGGITWKILYDKKQEKIKIENKTKEEARLQQEENERRIAEEKRLQDEADELARKALISQRETEKKAKEEEQRLKEAERKAKEAAQADAAEKKRLAEETQKKKDKTDFDQLKTEAEKLKSRGANPAEKIAQMKKIADKYPTDPYFNNTIKNLEN